MSDITLTVSAPGPTIELTADAPGAVTVTVNEGGGVSAHADLPDLSTSGHPASIITGLGTAATKNVGTTAGTVAAGDDSRLTDSRTPAGSAGGDLTGTYPNPTLGTSGVSAGSYGSASAIPVLTLDAKGRVTAASTASVTSGAMTVIARTVLGSAAASVDFTSIPATYENLLVSWVVRATSSSSWAIMYCRMNGDSTANYEWSYHRQTGGSGGQIQSASGETGLYAALTVDDAGTSGFAAYGSMLVPGYARTVFNKTAVGSSAAQYGVGTGKSSVGDYNGTWVSTAAVNQLTFYPSSGNFKAGSVFTLYGIAGA